MKKLFLDIKDFKNRQTLLMEKIGSHNAALIVGASTRNDQGNDFYYLSGIEEPHSYLFLDASKKKSVLFLPRQWTKHKVKDGNALSPENADPRVLGVDEIHDIAFLSTFLSEVKGLFIPTRSSECIGLSWDNLQRSKEEMISDPWDGRLDKSTHVISLLRKRFPEMKISDLCPVLDDMRMIKSQNEIKLLRRAGTLCARGIIEAMRCTAPGVMEYHLEAAMRYHYLAGGARDAAYKSIVAGGKNAWHSHYTANASALKDGDLVLVDGAPDFQYYTSDIGRMWPVNGIYSPEQRQLYGFIVEFHKVFLSSIRPGVTDVQITGEAARIMTQRLPGFSFSKKIYQQAAQRAVKSSTPMAHPVGMAVHDVGEYRNKKVLEPGMVIAIDPMMRVPEEHLFIRVEDTVVVTQKGIENLTADAPLELDDVEGIMREKGLLQAYPPLTEG